MPYHGTLSEFAALDRGDERDPGTCGRAAKHHRRGHEREMECPDSVAARSWQDAQGSDHPEGDPEQQTARRSARAPNRPSGSIVGLIGMRSVVQASAVSPAMIETAVYARSNGRRLAIVASPPPPESIGAARAADRGFVRAFRCPGIPKLTASGWTSIRGHFLRTTDIRMGDRSDCAGYRPATGLGEDGGAPRPPLPCVPPDNDPVAPTGLSSPRSPHQNHLLVPAPSRLLGNTYRDRRHRYLAWGSGRIRDRDRALDGRVAPEG